MAGYRGKRIAGPLQKHPAGTSIKSNFYLGLIGYFWFLSDLIDIFCAGGQIRPAEPVFDGEMGETGGDLGLFGHKWMQVHLVR